MGRVRVAVVAAILSRSLVAAADPSSTAPTPPPDIGVAGASDFVASDAASGRAYLSPTAFTAPAGTGSVETWFPGLPVAGVIAGHYALTDRIEIGAGATYDATDGVVAANYLEARVQVLRRRTAAVAIEWQRMTDPDGGSSGHAIDALTVVGSAVRGRTVLSASLTAIPDGDTLHVVGDGSIVTGGRWKLVGEAALFQVDTSRVLIGYAGGRYARSRFSADFGFAAAAQDGHAEPAPFPFAAIAARF